MGRLSEAKSASARSEGEEEEADADAVQRDAPARAALRATRGRARDAPGARATGVTRARDIAPVACEGGRGATASEAAERAGRHVAGEGSRDADFPPTGPRAQVPVPRSSLRHTDARGRLGRSRRCSRRPARAPPRALRGLRRSFPRARAASAPAPPRPRRARALARPSSLPGGPAARRWSPPAPPPPPPPRRSPRRARPAREGAVVGRGRGGPRGRARAPPRGPRRRRLRAIRDVGGVWV